MSNSNILPKTYLIEKFGESWYRVLKPYFDTPDFYNLGVLLNDIRSKRIIYPNREHVFRCFKETEYDNVYCVILGQDPYHDGSATGLAFDNAGKTKPSPSLRNILIELENCYGNALEFTDPSFHDLSHWAKQGVLLLNTALTVESGKPGSHSQLWYNFTVFVMKALANNTNPTVFMLWGNEAKEYSTIIESSTTKHLILKAAHPQAPNYGNKTLWFGNNHFNLANEFLRSTYNKEINWIH